MFFSTHPLFHPYEVDRSPPLTIRSNVCYIPVACKDCGLEPCTPTCVSQVRHTLKLFSLHACARLTNVPWMVTRQVVSPPPFLFGYMRRPVEFCSTAPTQAPPPRFALARFFVPPRPFNPAGSDRHLYDRLKTSLFSFSPSQPFGYRSFQLLATFSLPKTLISLFPSCCHGAYLK